jgi:hypothetical protein
VDTSGFRGHERPVSSAGDLARLTTKIRIAWLDDVEVKRHRSTNRVRFDLGFHADISFLRGLAKENLSTRGKNLAK